MSVAERSDSYRSMRSGKVGSHWGLYCRDRERLRLLGWAEHPQTERHINRLVSGDPDTGYIDWALSTFFDSPPDLGLSIGSGSGYLERLIIDHGLAAAMEGVDISTEALSVAVGGRGERAIDYLVRDLNTDELDPGRYDFAVSAAALHHVTNLEHCLEQLHGALKEDGLLVIYEYVGPDRFQWDDARMALVNRVYSRLPRRYRFNHLTERTRNRIERKPLAHMVEADPSESVRSSELPALISLYFETVEARPLGAGLLHPLLEGIIGNFDENDEVDRAYLDLVLALDEGLTSSGSLPADFIVQVMRRRREPLPGAPPAREGARKMDIIHRQEEEILELGRRLGEADERNRELAEGVATQQEEIERLTEHGHKLLAENEALKSRGPLKYVRFLKARRS
ncbi:MAG: methyltransferase domain-containing protein [Actinomycetota bacterium]